MSSPTRTEPAPTSDDEGGDSAAAPAVGRERTEASYVLHFHRIDYYVPADAVISLPTVPYVVSDGVALGSILASKSPDKWLACCEPEHLLMLQGREGTCVYAVFEVADGKEPASTGEESRFIRLVPTPVAEKNFPKVLAAVEADSERAQRVDVRPLKWKPEDCTTPQLSPVTNAWEVCAEPELKSCRVDPDRVPRKKRASSTSGSDDGEPALPEGIKLVKTIRVDTKSKYEVLQRPGLITIIGFNTADPPSSATEM